MTELLNVWLDDIRPAPEGWIPARTPDEVISHLRTGKIVEISLDYELNLPGDPEPCGSDVLRWIKRHLDEHPDYEPPTVHLHTACPFGRTEMNDILQRINAVLIRRSWGAAPARAFQDGAGSGRQGRSRVECAQMPPLPIERRATMDGRLHDPVSGLAFTHLGPDCKMRQRVSGLALRKRILQ